MKAQLFRLAYQLRLHRWGDTQLDILGRNLAFLAAAVILIQWLVRGRPSLPAWHWLALGLILLAGVGSIVLRIWAGRAGYVVFMPQPDLAAPAPREMSPEDKEAFFATGRFEVSEKHDHLANLTAYWRSFATREHAVMAIQHASRFFLGSLPADQIGMWYIFFRPEDIEEVTPGVVAFGASRRPGLRVAYRRLPPEDAKKPRKPSREVAYLAFESESGRERVWADLRADEQAG